MGRTNRSQDGIATQIVRVAYSQAAERRLALTLETHRAPIASTWAEMGGEALGSDLEDTLRTLITGLIGVLREGDWTVAQGVIDALAEERAGHGGDPQWRFQKALVTGRQAIRGYVDGQGTPEEEAFLDLLHECVFRYSESYQGVQVASESDRLHGRIIKSLVAALEARDPYTKGHSITVALICERLVEMMDSGDPMRAYLAGLLHDVGKVGVPDRILSKEGPLDAEEWKEMRAHPETGATILGPIRLYPDVVKAVRAHHENLDGSGYPDALAGDDIPLLARVIRVADSFDAMTSRRSFRESLSVDAALEELQGLKGHTYDPEVVDNLQVLVNQPQYLRRLSLASLQIDLATR